MGAASSIENADAPEKMTEEETDKFVEEHELKDGDGKLFKSLVGTDGMVARKSIVSIANDGTELEMLKLFTLYAVDDGVFMDNSGFIELLRDAKILSKHDLSTHYATMIFKEHSSKQDPPKRLNFSYFRLIVVPLIAEKKRLGVDNLLSKFCHMENRKAEEATVSEALDEEREENEENMSPSNEQNSAASKLQQFTRQNTASRRATYMRQCSNARQDPAVPEAMVLSNHITSEEDASKLESLFMRYTESYTTTKEFVRSLQRKGEMERKQFATLCKDAKFTKQMKLSAGDYNQVFDKAIAIALNPASAPHYKAEVFFNKRIGFSVFRDIIISCLTEITNLDIEGVISMLIATPEKAIVKEKMNLEELSVRTAASNSSHRQVLDQD